MKVHNKLFRALGALLIGVLLFAALPAGEAQAQTGSTINVSQPIQVTNNDHYERGQSIVYDGADYWLFYGRSASVTGNYQNAVPDVNDYAIYYKKASSIADLSSAAAVAVPGATNCYLGETSAAVYNGDVWAFCSPNDGTLSGFYTSDSGTNWASVKNMAAGMSTGAAHFDAAAYGGKLFLMINNPDSLSGWYTKYTTSPTTNSNWSNYVPLNSTSNLVNGTGHFFVDGTDLYIGLLRTSPTKDNKVLQYTPDSWTELGTASSSGWDATLFKAGGNYVFAQAPWNNEGGGRQYIYAWTGTSPDNVLDGLPKMVSEAKYGNNTWTDMWPIGFTDEGGQSYLFITSERDQPAQEGTGNIWYLVVDWDTTQDHYTYIQEAIDAASDGDTINVADGTYTITTAIDVNKGVTIIGNPSNPERVVVQYNPASTDQAIFDMNAADITVQGITAKDGKNGFLWSRADITSTYIGCTVTDCVVKNASSFAIGEIPAKGTVISNNTIDNCGDKGIYIRRCHATSAAEGAKVTGNTISGCEEAAIQVYDSPYTYVYNNTITSCKDKGINVMRTGTTSETRVQVIENTISMCKFPGIQSFGAPYTYIYNNTLSQCNYYGGDGTPDFDYGSITVADDGSVDGSYVVVDSNNVSDGGNGVVIWSDNCDVTNNTIYDMGLTYLDSKPQVVNDGPWYNSAIVIGGLYETDPNDPSGTTITGNCIHDNYWGLQHDSRRTNNVTAEDNWWGDPSGPTHSTNPGGLGDEVSDGVLFDPWLLWCPVDTKSTPVADNDSYQTDENVTLEIDPLGVLTNDTGEAGSKLEAELVDNVPAAEGTLTFNTDGSFTYEPPADWTGATSFTYRACYEDQPGNCSDPATVTLTVLEPAKAEILYHFPIFFNSEE